MMLLDSNVIIYAAQTPYENLREWLKQQSYIISELSRLEVLGYHGLTEKESNFFSNFFNESVMIPISNEVVNNAIPLRRGHNMSIGDAIIAATAQIFDCEICTNNQKDFRNIPGLNFADISDLV